MDDIGKRLEDIEKRLGLIETRLGAGAAASQSAQAGPQKVPTGSVFDPLPDTWPQKTSADSHAPFQAASAPIAKKERKNVESYIGRWLLGVVGVVAVILGASFFLKYAFESNLIGPAGRVALGVIGGLLFVVLGEVFRSRLAKYSYILSGGGLALFYLSIYSAFHYYHLIGPTAAFSFMIVVSAFGVVLALWASAMELAGLAVFGGFLTPYLASSGVANDFGFFGYIAILNVGILAIALFKKWHELTLLAFTGTVINFASWYGVYYESEKLSIALVALTMYYMTFLLAGFAANAVTRKVSARADLFVLSVNAAWFFGWCYYLLRPQYSDWLGFIAAGLGAVYIFFAYAASVLNPEDKNHTLLLGAIAVVFLTIAIPLQLEQNVITIAWAVEAAVLLTLGFFMKNSGMRIFALGVFLLSAIRAVAYDSSVSYEAFLPIFNKRFFTYAMVIFSATIMGYLAHIKRGELEARERGAGPFLWSAANILFLIAVTLEIFTFYDVRLQSAREEIERERRKNIPVQSETYSGYGDYYSPQNQYGGFGTVYNDPYANYDAKYRSLTNQRNAAISVFWALYAIILMTLGMVIRNSYVRWGALALFGLTIFKVFIIDLASLRTPYRIISFTVLGFILLAASYLYFRYQKSVEGQGENTAQ